MDTEKRKNYLRPQNSFIFVCVNMQLNKMYLL